MSSTTKRGRLVQSGRPGDTIKITLPDGRQVVVTVLPRRALHIDAPLDVHVRRDGRRPIMRDSHGQVTGVRMEDGSVER